MCSICVQPVSFQWIPFFLQKSRLIIFCSATGHLDSQPDPAQCSFEQKRISWLLLCLACLKAAAAGSASYILRFLSSFPLSSCLIPLYVGVVYPVVFFQFMWPFVQAHLAHRCPPMRLPSRPPSHFILYMLFFMRFLYSLPVARPLFMPPSGTLVVGQGSVLTDGGTCFTQP